MLRAPATSFTERPANSRVSLPLPKKAIIAVIGPRASHGGLTPSAFANRSITVRATKAARAGAFRDQTRKTRHNLSALGGALGEATQHGALEYCEEGNNRNDAEHTSSGQHAPRQLKLPDHEL